MVLVLLATMGFFFLSFQMFSVHLLSQEHRRTSFLWGSSSSRRRKNGVLDTGGGGAIDSLLANGHERDPEQVRHLQNQILDKYLEELQREEGSKFICGFRLRLKIGLGNLLWLYSRSILSLESFCGDDDFSTYKYIRKT